MKRPTGFMGVLSLLCAVLPASTVHAQASALTGPAGPEGRPVEIGGARQYDIESRITGRTYRLWVSSPPDGRADALYPALYVLDGNYYFATVHEAARRQAFLKIITPVIVIAIGYPTDDFAMIRSLRMLDLTPSKSRDTTVVDPSGEGDAFLRFIEEEAKPFLASRYRIDPDRQVLWGHSLGALAGLRSLLRSPGMYSTYVLSSPSVWYNERDILADTAAFARSSPGVGKQLKVLITSAGDEGKSMVDDASALTEWMRTFPSRVLRVDRVVFSGEMHGTVSPASLSRALRYAFSIPQ